MFNPVSFSKKWVIVKVTACLLTKYCYDIRGPSVGIVRYIRGLVLARRRVKVGREMRATAELPSISRWGGREADCVKNDPWLRSHIC